MTNCMREEALSYELLAIRKRESCRPLRNVHAIMRTVLRANSKEPTWARRVQVIGILRSIIGWKTGSYTIVADYLPKREEGTLFPLAQIIVELVVTDTDRTKSEQAMESGNAIFEKAPNFDDAF